MKAKFLGALMFLLIFTTSCKEEELVAVKIPRTNLEITLYESEAKIYDTYNSVVKDNDAIFFGKNKSTVIYDEIDENYFPNDVDFLVKALDKHDNIKKYTFKNGAFGVSYETNPDEKGRTDKLYYFYFKKNNRYYKFQSHLANNKMKHFDNVKKSMESLQ